MRELACGLLLGCKISQLLAARLIELELCFGSMNSSMCNLKLLWFFPLQYPASSSKTSQNVAGQIGLFWGYCGPGPTEVKIPAFVLILFSDSVPVCRFCT